MDLDSIAQEPKHHDDAAECVLYDDNGEPEKDSTGAVATLLFVSHQSKAMKAVQKKVAAKEKMLARRFGGVDKIPEALQEELSDERIAGHLVGWRGFESKGTPFLYSYENAIALTKGLREHRPTQFVQFCNDISTHASFFTQSSTG